MKINTISNKHSCLNYLNVRPTEDELVYIIHLYNWNQNRTVYRYSKEGLGAVDQSLLKRD